VDDERARVLPLKAAFLRARSAFRRFLAAHPEKALASADYREYTRLHAAYEVALQRVNAQIDRFNEAVAAYNGALEACRI
jgi:hypothetical protein